MSITNYPALRGEYTYYKIPGERVLEFHVSGSSSDVDACVVVVDKCRPSHVSVIARQMRTESHCGKSTRRQSHFSIVKFLLECPRIIHRRHTSRVTQRHFFQSYYVSSSSSNYRQGKYHWATTDPLWIIYNVSYLTHKNAVSTLHQFQNLVTYLLQQGLCKSKEWPKRNVYLTLAETMKVQRGSTRITLLFNIGS